MSTPDRLDESEISQKLSAVPDWKLEGTDIVRPFEFADFAEAVTFVNEVAKIAEDANHHPDIDIRWNKVLLRLSTHSKGGLTSLDFLVAERIDGIDLI